MTKQIFENPKHDGSLVTEQYGKLGFGAVLIDQQHGLLDERTAFECVQRLEKFPSCFPIIRVCDNSTALISRALDAGATGKYCLLIGQWILTLSSDWSRHPGAHDQHGGGGQEAGPAMSVSASWSALLGTHQVTSAHEKIDMNIIQTVDRALMIGTPPDEANKYVRVFAMIETAEAIKNLDEILDVEGLDGVFVGKKFDW